MLGLVLLSIGISGADDLAFTKVEAHYVGNERLLSIALRLKNVSKRSIKIWDPANVEGQNCVRFSLKDNDGRETLYRPLVPPRAGGVPTAIVLRPNEAVDLAPCNLADVRKTKNLPKGLYQLTAIYQSEFSSFHPVEGAWVGTIRAKPIKVTLN